jgi:hypothetical protein
MFIVSVTDVIVAAEGIAAAMSNLSNARRIVPPPAEPTRPTNR